MPKRRKHVGWACLNKISGQDKHYKAKQLAHKLNKITITGPLRQTMQCHKLQNAWRRQANKKKLSGRMCAWSFNGYVLLSSVGSQWGFEMLNATIVLQVWRNTLRFHCKCGGHFCLPTTPTDTPGSDINVCVWRSGGLSATMRKSSLRDPKQNKRLCFWCDDCLVNVMVLFVLQVLR